MPGTDKAVVPLICAFQREVYNMMGREGREADWAREKEPKESQASDGQEEVAVAGK